MDIIEIGSMRVEYVRSKSGIKGEMKYVREMCRQIVQAIDSGDLADAIEAANEGSAALATVMEELEKHLAVAEGRASVVRKR